MPYNIQNIDLFIEKLTQEENLFLEKMKNDHEEIKKKLSDLVVYLNDVNHSIQIHLEKKENDFKFNCQLIKQVFTNYYHDINSTEDSNYLKLHYLKNLPKSFGDFTFDSHTNAHIFDSVFNTIKNNISKLKDDSKQISYTIRDNVNFKCIQTLGGHTHYVSSLIQLQNGMIASGSYDSTIRIWDPTQNFKCIQTLEGHSDVVYSLIQLQNGMIASGSSDNTIRI